MKQELHGSVVPAVRSKFENEGAEAGAVSPP